MKLFNIEGTHMIIREGKKKRIFATVRLRKHGDAWFSRFEKVLRGFSGKNPGGKRHGHACNLKEECHSSDWAIAPTSHLDAGQLKHFKYTRIIFLKKSEDGRTSICPA